MNRNSERTQFNGAIHRLDQLIVGLSAVASIVGLTLGFAIPCTVSEVAAGQALFQNFVWILAASLAAIHLWFAHERCALIAKPKNHRWLLVGLSALICCIGLVVLSTLIAGRAANYRHALNSMWQWVSCILIVFTLSVLVLESRRDRNQVRIDFTVGLFWFCILAILMLALHGLHQVVISFPADIRRYKLAPDEVLEMAGINAPPNSAARMLFESRLFDRAPTATFALTNSLAVVLATAGVLLMSQLHKTYKSASRLNFAVLLILLIPILICLIWTKSRTAWLGFLFGLIVIAAMRFVHCGPVRKNLHYWAVSCSLGVCLLMGLIYWWDPLVLSQSLRSLFFRANYWSATWKMVGDHPWLGIGPGNFQQYFTQYKDVLAAEAVADPHSMWFETLAIGGPFALASLIIGFSCLIVAIIRSPNFRRPLQGPFAGIDISFESKTNQTLSKRLESLSISSLVFNRYSLGLLVSSWLLWLTYGMVGVPPEPLLYFALGLIACGLGVLIFCFGTPMIEMNASESILPALLVCLLTLSFTGGWITPGITNLMCVLVAWSICNLLGENFSKAETPSSTSQSVVREIGRIAFVLTFVLGTLGGLFYVTTWRPVQRSAEYLVTFSQLRTMPPAGLLDDLVNADECDPKPWRLAGTMSHDMTIYLAGLNRGRIDDKSLGDFTKFSAGYVQRDSQNWEAWTQRGHWELGLSALDPAWLGRANEDFEAAVLRYPGDVEVLLQAALSNYLIGQYDAADRLLARAETIDANVEHLDRKLSAGLVYFPQALVAGFAQSENKELTASTDATQNQRNRELLAIILSPDASHDGWLPAEPLAKAMRRQLARIR